MTDSPSYSTILADMRDWIVDCIHATGYPADDREFFIGIAENAPDRVIRGMVSDTHDRGIMGFCDHWYGARWGHDAYETVMTIGITTDIGE